MPDSPRIFMSAAEISADVAGARLASALRLQDPHVVLFGTGGRHMKESGVEVEMETTHLGSVAFTEPPSRLPELVRTFRQVRRLVQRRRPHLAVLINFEGFKLLLARWLTAQGIPSVCFLPPRAWMWRSMAGPVSRLFDLILASLPVEEEIYSAAGGRVLFVGHYLKDLLNGTPPRAEQPRPMVALFPGSRRREVVAFTPLLLETARRLGETHERLRFQLPVADRRFRGFLHAQVQSRGLGDAVQITESGFESLRVAELAIMAAGTATLEAALLEVPLIVIYRVSPLTLAGIRVLQGTGVLRDELISLPNLLAQRRIVPELHQRQATVSGVVAEAERLLEDETLRRQMKRELAEISALLGDGKSLERSAALILEEAGRARTAGNGR